MTMLAIAGLIFLAIHILPVTQLRARAVAAIGEDRYLGAFVVASLVTFSIWTWMFALAPAGERAWYYPTWWPWLKAVILLFAFVLFVAGVSSPNPTAVRQGQLLERSDVGAGVFAITRHPLMWAFGLWGAAHFVSQPDWRGFWFFGIFAITALGGAWLQEIRKAKVYGAGWANFAAKTSFLPFLALAQGRARLRFDDIGWWRIGLAVMIWALLLYLHPWLFRVSPLPGLA